MKQSNRDLIPWSIVVLASLGAAYWASLPVSDKAAAKVSVVSLGEAKLSVIELVSNTTNVQFTKRADIGDRWWVTVERKNQNGLPGEAEKPATKDRFLASPKFKDMLAQFSPFQALRVIGAANDQQLQEFGLKDPKKSLVVKDTAGGVQLSLAIGSQLYGSRNYYVLNQLDKKVLLVAGDLINDLEKPDLRVFERGFTSISPEEIQAGKVTSGAKSRAFGHTRRDDKGVLIWTADGGDGSAVPQAGSWFDKFFQLKGAVYASDEEQASLAQLPILFEVKIDGPGAASELVQVRKRPGTPAAEYWLTSAYLNWHVKVAATRGEILEKDLVQLWGNDSAAPIR